MFNDVRSLSQGAADEGAVETAESSSQIANAATFPYAYHEMNPSTEVGHIVRVDVLEQLKANIAQLEDLHLRLKFMMGEVGALLKKN